MAGMTRRYVLAAAIWLTVAVIAPAILLGGVAESRSNTTKRWSYCERGGISVEVEVVYPEGVHAPVLPKWWCPGIVQILSDQD